MAWCTKRGRAVAVGRAENDIEFPFAPVSGPVLAIACTAIPVSWFPDCDRSQNSSMRRHCSTGLSVLAQFPSLTPEPATERTAFGLHQEPVDRGVDGQGLDQQAKS